MNRKTTKESVQTGEAFKGIKRDACTAFDESQVDSYTETIGECERSQLGVAGDSKDNAQSEFGEFESSQLMFGDELDVLTACV